jgi:hypothetical protein
MTYNDNSVLEHLLRVLPSPDFNGSLLTGARLTPRKVRLTEFIEEALQTAGIDNDLLLALTGPG